MTARMSTSLKKAFKRFVELVEPIDDVCYVVAFDEDELEISTYITRPDEDVMSRVFRAEFEIMKRFPLLPIDFHVWFLEGRPLEALVNPIPPLIYSRERREGRKSQAARSGDVGFF